MWSERRQDPGRVPTGGKGAAGPSPCQPEAGARPEGGAGIPAEADYHAFLFSRHSEMFRAKAKPSFLADGSEKSGR